VSTSNLDDIVRPRQEALTVIWLAMTASIGVYAMIVSVVTRDWMPGEVGLAAGIVFRLMAVGLTIASIMVPRRMLSAAQITELMRTEPDLKALATRGRSHDADLEELRQLHALPKLDQHLVALVQQFRTPYIVGLAFSEAVAFLGLVFGLMAHNMFASLPLLAAALALNGYHYPRLTKLLDRGRKLQHDEELDSLKQDLQQLEKDLRKRPRMQKPSRPKPPARKPNAG
jgi:F0F1-type ATP synthase membrane subunit c/vacuolar-type H+-ATPase subunit K